MQYHQANKTREAAGTGFGTVQQGCASGAQNHQAARGKQAKEARHDARTWLGWFHAGLSVWVTKSPGRARKESERSEKGCEDIRFGHKSPGRARKGSESSERGCEDMAQMVS